MLESVIDRRRHPHLAVRPHLGPCHDQHQHHHHHHHHRFALLGMPCAVLLLCPLVAPAAGVPSAGVAAAPAAEGAPPFEPVTLQRIPLPPAISEASSPVFTLDGGHLLFFSAGQLWLVGVDGSGPACLTCGVAGTPAIPVSEQEGIATEFPDRRRVFFGGPNTSRAVLECAPDLLRCRDRRVLPVDFSGGRPDGGITLPGGAQSLPSWDIGGASSAKLAPDGVHVAFSDIATDAVEEMIIGTLVRTPTGYVVTDPRVINPPGASGDDDPDPAHWSAGEALYEFKTFADGGAVATYVSAGAPVAGNPEVMAVNLATGARTRLTAHPDWDEDDAPSPDGSSLVVESDRTMHRTDVLGLLPVRGFADAPVIAAAAGYYVGSPARRQCDLQPWLLPAGGDDGAVLVGQPLQPYSGGDVHAANNVSGFPQWSPDGTAIALNTESFSAGESAPYLLVAHLTARVPTRPLPAVSSQPGPWAPAPQDFHGSLAGNHVAVLPGAAAGTVSLLHLGLGILSGIDRVVYRGYSDDGRSFTTGTTTVVNVSTLSGPVRVDSDLAMTGEHQGDQHVHVTYLDTDPTRGWTETGTETATLDGTTVTGPPAEPADCPQSLPAPPRLTLSVSRSGTTLAVHVGSAIAGAGPAERGVDSRPVLGAVVTLAGRSARTDRSGNARLGLPPGTGDRAVLTATAGDTFAPATLPLGGASREG